MPQMNPAPNISTPFNSQTQQQQIANMMMANLITEQARLFHQYSVSSAAMSYLTNTTTSECSLPPGSLTSACQPVTNINVSLSNTATMDGTPKSNSMNENALCSLRLSDLLNQKPSLDISIRSNEQEVSKERGLMSSLISPSIKDLDTKHDK